MGFNIGVFSEQTPNNFDCHHFVDRAFYNFVNDGEQYGDESILIKSGQYYGLDLSPLLSLSIHGTKSLRTISAKIFNRLTHYLI